MLERASASTMCRKCKTNAATAAIIPAAASQSTLKNRFIFLPIRVVIWQAPSTASLLQFILRLALLGVAVTFGSDARNYFAGMRSFISLPITQEGGSLDGKDSCDASSTRSSTSSDFEISEVGASCLGGLVASIPMFTGDDLNVSAYKEQIIYRLDSIPLAVCHESVMGVRL